MLVYSLNIFIYLIIPDPETFSRPETLGVIPDNILCRMKPLKNFIKLNVLTRKQQQFLETMLIEAEKSINDTFTTYATNAKTQFEALVKSDTHIQQRLHTYLQDNTEHGNFMSGLIFKNLYQKSTISMY